MSAYPITVRAMSRFQSKREQDETIRGLRRRHRRHRGGHPPAALQGHPLEEARAARGRRRAALRRRPTRSGSSSSRRNLDVLTLSATPIPRTLQMAVTGLRDMSLISTPPVDRRAIRTDRHAPRRECDPRRHPARARPRRTGVLRLQPRRGALRAGRPPRRDLSRGAHLRRARAAGREHAWSRRCSTSSRGATTSSARQPSSRAGSTFRGPTPSSSTAPTCSGSSQLYQLRGRVGRAKERAYCYLIVPPPNAMTDEARARIEALERHTELGCGLSDRVARPRAPRCGRPARGGAKRQRRVGGLRALLRDARGGRPRAARRTTSFTTSTPSCPSTTRRCFPRTTSDEVGVRLSLYKRLAERRHHRRRARPRA